MIAFLNANVFDGVSQKLKRTNVVVEHDTIVAVSDAPPSSGAQSIDCSGLTLMPGLIDLHTHIWYSDVDGMKASRRASEYNACFAVSSLKRSLDYGFTSMRDAGGTDASYARAIEDGTIIGPRFFPSGRMISQTGGHDDMREPDSYHHTDKILLEAGHSRYSAIVDSPDAMRKAVREEFRRGATQIKLMMSGGATSPSDKIDGLQFSDEEVSVAVAEAQRHGSYCFAHCHPLKSIERAIELGIRTIEHATYIDSEVADLAAERSVYIVPTLAVVWSLVEEGERLGLPTASREKLKGLQDVMLNSLRILKEAGVKVGFGTDLLGSLQQRQTSEFSLRSTELSNFDILRSATSVGAEILGQEANLGVIAAGAKADLLLIKGDPLQDITLLDSSGEQMAAIMKNGNFHKNELGLPKL